MPDPQHLRLLWFPFQVQSIEFTQIEMKVMEGLQFGNECLNKMHQVGLCRAGASRRGEPSGAGVGGRVGGLSHGVCVRHRARGWQERCVGCCQAGRDAVT